jgi:hypothetical protein
VEVLDKAAASALPFFPPLSSRAAAFRGLRRARGAKASGNTLPLRDISSRTCGDAKEPVGRKNLEDYNADFLVMLET